MLYRLLPHCALLIAMFVWGSSFIALKIALTAFTPLEIMGGRMTIAAIIIAPVLRSLWRSIQQHGQKKIILFMVCSEPCLYFLCETNALRFTSASQAGMLVALLPLCVATTAFFLLKEKSSPRSLFGLSLAITGAIWLSYGSIATESAPKPILGNCLQAIAIMCGAAYTVCAKKLAPHYKALELTSMQVFAGFLFYLPLSLLPFSSAVVTLPVALPTWLPFMMVIYLGSCVTFGGYGLYNYGIRHLKAGQAAAYTNLIPVCTLAMGVLFLEEHFSPTQYLASALVIAGVLLSQQQKLFHIRPSQRS